ncbi:MAG: DUF4105 domain-containing protein [bacterium]|nr:DUF4105 domain-containing protein [bacterium]
MDRAAARLLRRGRELPPKRLKLFKVVTGVLLVPILLLVALWTALALHYSPLPYAWMRDGAAAVFVVGFLAAFAFLPKRRRTLVVYLAVFVAVLGWFLSIQASNDRDWRTEVAVLPGAVIEGDIATVTNIRNFDYATRDDFTVRYYDRAFDLSKLVATDLLFSYWDGNESIAHTMLSFDFGGDDVLCLSVEVRREKEEGWGGLPGMFKQFELIYVLADERDLVRLRTNYRAEEVYLFRTALSAAESRQLLTHILGTVERLREHPQFYRTILRNCTTALVDHVNAIWPDRTPLTKKILMNGYAPEQGYERGMLKSELPFEEYKRSCHINPAAAAAEDAEVFSRKIRAHLAAAPPK